jgi:hypothetical protein
MLANQYCEIITGSVHEIISAEALKLRDNIKQLRIGIIKTKTTTEYIVSYDNDTKTVKAAISNDSYLIGDNVYFTIINDNTAII